MIRALMLLCIVALILLIGFIVLSPVTLGNNPLDQQSAVVPLCLMSLLTFVGICSRSVFRNVLSGETLMASLKARDVLLSSIVAPISLLTIYNLSSQISDLFLLSLLSYQNGFFVDNVAAYIVHAQKTQKSTRH
jgi:hypothetical protein